jgi:hypothetical protein
MSDEQSSGGSGGSGSGGGFGWFILGGIVGLAAGAYIASGPGRGQVDSIRSKTIELSSSEPVQKAKQAAQRARVAVTDPDNPVGKAIQDGVAAAKRRREELEAAATRKIKSATNGEDSKKGTAE